MLPAAVEIAVAAGEAEEAAGLRGALRRAGGHLRHVGPPRDRGLHRAARWRSPAATRTAPTPPSARRARRWESTGATYDVARAREQLGRALRASGDEDAAVWELQAAAARFERLGAVRDADRVAELLMRDTSTEVLKTFLFTDIVGSTELATAVGSDRHWVTLLRRHDDALRAIFADFHGQVVDHTGDGFFAAFEEAADAVAAATAIQQAVDRDFEFDIRIGVHTDGALKTRENYHGKGVHAAARIGAAAEGREILASRATLAGLADVEVTNDRSLTLKGFKEPVDVCSVEWAPTRLRPLAALVAAALLLPACGGGETSPSRSPPRRRP